MSISVPIRPTSFTQKLQLLMIAHSPVALGSSDFINKKLNYNLISPAEVSLNNLNRIFFQRTKKEMKIYSIFQLSLALAGKARNNQGDI